MQTDSRGLGLRIRLAAGMGAARYLTVGMATAAATLFVPPLLMIAAVSTAFAGAGLVLLPWALSALRTWTDAERLRVGRYLGQPIPPQYQPLPGGVGARLRHVFTDRTILRDLAWVPAHIGMGIPLGMLGLSALIGGPITLAQMALWWLMPADLPLSLLGMPVTSWGTALAAGGAQLALIAGLLLWAAVPLARLHASTARVLLTPSRAEQLAERVETLTETRSGALDAHAAELRRIERDLHDGTQAQLVALAMRLGLAERTLEDDPQAAARLLREAQSGAEDAMAELRQVIRTIYPPILSDRGLAGAASALAARSTVPVRLSVGELGEVPAAVEATAYHVIAEALTNTAKHSAASQAEVALERNGMLLRVEVADDGIGGVDEAQGSGVAGMARRVAALDGELTVHGPVGGPTTVKAELPCGS